MRKRFRAFTLIELLAGLAVVSLLVSLGVPTSFRAREMSKRMVCSVNLKGIGAAAQIYAARHNGSWMVPPFRAALIDDDGDAVDYVCEDTTTDPWPDARDPGEVGYYRPYQSTSETESFPNAGSTALSVTRAYWMLVRSGDVPRPQFICPSSDDTTDGTVVVDSYYDFAGYRNISYGYQVPFGPPLTRPREGSSNRQIVAADKSPFYLESFRPRWVDSKGRGIDLGDPPEAWRPYNSPNHGGVRSGEGQNCLYTDGHVSFHRMPAVGIDNDNIYTVMTDEWKMLIPYHRIHGDTVHLAAVQWPYPGEYALGWGPGQYSSTDTLIYP